MKKLNVITLFPELIQNAVQFGVLGQAIKKNILSITCVNPRAFTSDVHKTVDDRPFGGGDGMIMLFEPLEKALKSIPDTENQKVIYLSPQGQVLTDKKARELANLDEVTFICGRYGGIDQRFINEFVDEELSIGDYVLSGGEFAALTVIDALSRHIPGVLGHVDSSTSDSFANGLLEAPAYTRPQAIEDQAAPEILLGGHHQKISDWKKFMSWMVTFHKRNDLKNLIKVEPAERKDLLKLVDSLQEADLKTLGIKNFNLQEFRNWIEDK